MFRLRVGNNVPGPKPKWTFDGKHGAQVRTSKAGGIDWIRYRKEVQKPLFIPFVESLQKKYPKIRFIAQEDNASFHVSKWVRDEWTSRRIPVLEWPPNSPDLNVIESPWMRMKLVTSQVNKSYNESEMRTAWVDKWKGFPREKFQRYVSRVQQNLWWVIYRLGSNNYPEGTWPPYGMKKKGQRGKAPDDDLKKKWVAEAEKFLKQNNRTDYDPAVRSSCNRALDHLVNLQPALPNSFEALRFRYDDSNSDSDEK